MIAGLIVSFTGGGFGEALGTALGAAIGMTLFLIFFAGSIGKGSAVHNKMMSAAERRKADRDQ